MANKIRSPYSEEIENLSTELEVLKSGKKKIIGKKKFILIYINNSVACCTIYYFFVSAKIDEVTKVPRFFYKLYLDHLAIYCSTVGKS